MSIVSPTYLLRSARPSNLIIRRSSSKSQDLRRGTVASHLLAGVLGGVLVSVAAYTYYHFSPLKPIVETSRRAQAYAENAQKGFKENLQGRFIEALRKTAKAYVIFFPGADIIVDVAFDSLGDVLEDHGEEVDRIAAKALEEIQRLVGLRKDRTQTALAIIDLLKIHLGEIQALGTNTKTTAEPLLETVHEEILLLARPLSPEAKRAIDEQVQSVLSFERTSSVLRTIEEKTAWFRRSFRGGDSAPETQKDESTPQATEKEK